MNDIYRELEMIDFDGKLSIVTLASKKMELSTLSKKAKFHQVLIQISTGL